MSAGPLTPSTAAYKLTHILSAFAKAQGKPRLPIDVPPLALESARFFGWADPISEVKAASIARFEGALFPDHERRKWLLLYNERLASEGRIRFTQAHELGHYLLHRTVREHFECTADNMLEWDAKEVDFESQADYFAATLLMPLDDFRQQVDATADFEALGAAARRYGMSLTAVTLRWLEHTEAVSVLVVHRDDYILWARSSKPAMRAGAYFKTRERAIPIPCESIAANPRISNDRKGLAVPANLWFPHAEEGLSLREMKICADQYDWTMTLLVLPRGSSVWKPRGDDTNS